MLTLKPEPQSLSSVIAEIMISADDLTYSQVEPNLGHLASLSYKLEQMNMQLPAARMFAGALYRFAEARYEQRWMWLAVLATLRPLAEQELLTAEASIRSPYRSPGAHLS